MNTELLEQVSYILRGIVYELHCSHSRRFLCYHIMTHISGYHGPATFIH